jgi:chemotaxis response regulator CheB
MITVPSRIGESWTNQEEQELLKEIQKKVPIDMIAELHERTECGIRSRLRYIALEHYTKKQTTIERIEEITGLRKQVIQRIIEKQKQEKQARTAKAPIKDSPVVRQEKESDTKEIICLLKDIKGLLERFLQSIHYEE